MHELRRFSIATARSLSRCLDQTRLFFTFARNVEFTSREKVFDKRDRFGVPGQDPMMSVDTGVVVITIEVNATLSNHPIFCGLDDPKLNSLSSRVFGS